MLFIKEAFTIIDRTSDYNLLTDNDLLVAIDNLSEH